MVEKRTIKRRHIIYYLRLYDRLTDQLIGQLVDISQNGIQLITEAPIDAGVTLHLRMILPETIDRRKEILCDVVTLWCQKDINPNFYGVGCEFIDIKKKDIEIVDNLIHDFAFQD